MDESDVGQFSEKKEFISDELKAHYFQIIRDLADYTFKQYGIKTVFHPHIKSLFEYEVEIEKLKKQSLKI